MPKKEKKKIKKQQQGKANYSQTLLIPTTALFNNQTHTTPRPLPPPPPTPHPPLPAITISRGVSSTPTVQISSPN